MKNKILIAGLFCAFFISGCTLPGQEETKPVKQFFPSITVQDQINTAIKSGSTTTEMAAPKMLLPPDVNPAQIQKYFKIRGLWFALVQQGSMNVPLSVPNDFKPTFNGVLFAMSTSAQWEKFAEIKDAKATDKNNPYYLSIENGKLLLTIVDQNGAGSGEGYETVYSMNDGTGWTKEKCYYFGAHYNDQETDGDYFAYSAKFEKQEVQSLEKCTAQVNSVE